MGSKFRVFRFLAVAASLAIALVLQAYYFQQFYAKSDSTLPSSPGKQTAKQRLESHDNMIQEINAKVAHLEDLFKDSGSFKAQIQDLKSHTVSIDQIVNIVASDTLLNKKKLLHETSLKLWEVQQGKEREEITKQLKANSGKRMEPLGGKVGIITAYTSDYKNKAPTLCELMHKNRDSYAAKHGYKHIFVNLDSYITEDAKKYPLAWLKLDAIKDVLNQDPSLEWVVWMDTDAVIMNEQIDLGAHFLNPEVLKDRISYGCPVSSMRDIYEGNFYPLQSQVNVNDIDLIISHDAFSINAGIFALRRSHFVMETLLPAWMGYKHNTSVDLYRAEQDALLVLFFNNEQVHKRLAIVPQMLLNTYPDAYDKPAVQWHEGDWVVHFPGWGVSMEGLEKGWKRYYNMGPGKENPV